MHHLKTIFATRFAGSSSNDPTAQIATNPSRNPSRSAPPELSGRPPPQTARQSSAPPSPRAPTEFAALPDDALCKIVEKMCDGLPLAEEGRILRRMPLTNKAFYRAVSQTANTKKPSLIRHYAQELKAQKLVDEILSVNPGDVSLSPVGLCVPVLNLLSPALQDKLVDRLIQGLKKKKTPASLVDETFKQFVPQLEHLTMPLRAKVVALATGYKEDEHSAMAIRALSGGGLSHLDEHSIQRLVDKANGLPAKWCAQAIRDLSVGLENMKPEQRDRLWTMAKGLKSRRLENQATAFGGLCAKRKHLRADQRAELGTWATGHCKYQDNAPSLAKLIDVLDDAHKDTVLTHAITMSDELSKREAKREALCTLAAKMEILKPDQRSRLADEILRREQKEEIAALWPGIKHLTDPQLNRLLVVTSRMDSIGKSIAVPGLAEGLQALDPSRRGRVVAKLAAIVLEMPGVQFVPELIGTLGPHLKLLGEEERNALVKRAVEILGALSHPYPHAPFSPSIQALTRGLGAGLGALSVDERQALVTAVATAVAQLDPSTPEPWHAPSPPSVAQAIAGLALGGHHLDDSQFKTLVDAADEFEKTILKDERGDVSFRLNTRAIATFGLATA